MRLQFLAWISPACTTVWKVLLGLEMRSRLLQGIYFQPLWLFQSGFFQKPALRQWFKCKYFIWKLITVNTSRVVQKWNREEKEASKDGLLSKFTTVYQLELSPAGKPGRWHRTCCRVISAEGWGSWNIYPLKPYLWLVEGCFEGY